MQHVISNWTRKQNDDGGTIFICTKERSQPACTAAPHVLGVAWRKINNLVQTSKKIVAVLKNLEMYLEGHYILTRWVFV